MCCNFLFTCLSLLLHYGSLKAHSCHWMSYVIHWCLLTVHCIVHKVGTQRKEGEAFVGKYKFFTKCTGKYFGFYSVWNKLCLLTKIRSFSINKKEKGYPKTSIVFKSGDEILNQGEILSVRKGSWRGCLIPFFSPFFSLKKRLIASTYNICSTWNFSVLKRNKVP